MVRVAPALAAVNSNAVAQATLFRNLSHVVDCVEDSVYGDVGLWHRELGYQLVSVKGSQQLGHRTANGPAGSDSHSVAASGRGYRQRSDSLSSVGSGALVPGGLAFGDDNHHVTAAGLKRDKEARPSVLASTGSNALISPRDGTGLSPSLASTAAASVQGAAGPGGPAPLNPSITDHSAAEDARSVTASDTACDQDRDRDAWVLYDDIDNTDTISQASTARTVGSVITTDEGTSYVRSNQVLGESFWQHYGVAYLRSLLIAACHVHCLTSGAAASRMAARDGAAGCRHVCGSAMVSA